jgi:hypothetical protein
VAKSREGSIPSIPTTIQCEVCDLLGQLIGFQGTFESLNNQPDACSDTCD